MWEVPNPTIDLYPGFRLMEDENFVYLFYREELVATFLASRVDVKEIEKAMYLHIDRVAQKFK